MNDVPSVDKAMPFGVQSDKLIRAVGKMMRLNILYGWMSVLFRDAIVAPSVNFIEKLGELHK